MKCKGLGINWLAESVSLRMEFVAHMTYRRPHGEVQKKLLSEPRKRGNAVPTLEDFPTTKATAAKIGDEGNERHQGDGNRREHHPSRGT